MFLVSKAQFGIINYKCPHFYDSDTFFSDSDAMMIYLNFCLCLVKWIVINLLA